MQMNTFQRINCCSLQNWRSCLNEFFNKIFDAGSSLQFSQEFAQYHCAGMSAEDYKLRDSISHNFPDALPDASTARPIYNVGSVITPSPLAIDCVPLAYFASRLKLWKENSRTPCATEKLGWALSKTHAFLSEFYQPQGSFRRSHEISGRPASRQRHWWAINGKGRRKSWCLRESVFSRGRAMECGVLEERNKII